MYILLLYVFFHSNFDLVRILSNSVLYPINVNTRQKQLTKKNRYLNMPKILIESYTGNLNVYIFLGNSLSNSIKCHIICGYRSKYRLKQRVSEQKYFQRRFFIIYSYIYMKNQSNNYLKRNTHPHPIRVRRSPMPKNMSPDRQKQRTSNEYTSSDFGNLKKIAKIVQLKDNQLIQGCFSYVDEGFQKWKIGRIVGKGYWCVRKAMNVKTGIISAVKQIKINQEQEKEKQKEKLNEIKILKKLKHPNIVQYFQDYKINQSVWIFMEFVESNLRKFYLDFGPAPTQITLKFAKQIVSALAYLQKNNVIHKDIKCQNILISGDGVIKLCDFGCSKDFQSTMSLNLYEKKGAVKSFKGSYLWTAPQCFLSNPCLASDIWSFGCTLVELASGKLPWSQKKMDNPLMAIKIIVQSNQTPLIDQNWDPRVKQIITNCLKRDPAQRIRASQLNQRKDLWS